MSFQQEQLQAIADAIREKDGTTDPIMPVDFPDRIRALSTGGGGLPDGGAINQALLKNSSDDGDTRWGNVALSFNGRSGLVFPQEGDYTADDVGAVPTTRKINNIPLTDDITISATDIGAVNQAYVVNALHNIEQDYNQKFGVSSAQLQMLKNVVDSLITYGTESLVAGTSNLPTGTIYVKYE